MAREELIIRDRFYNYELSKFERQMGYLCYGTMVKPFADNLNNDLCDFYNLDDADVDWEYFNLPEDYPENCEIYQYYRITDKFANFLKQYTDEIVLYNAELRMFVWGVTHVGTDWDFVLTNIQIKKGE